MFNKEFIEMHNPMACLGMSLALKEQHNNEAARKCVFELFFDYSVKQMQGDFDHLVKKGVIPLSDTKMIATLFMFCVIVSNDLRVDVGGGPKLPLDSMEIYNALKKMIILSFTLPN
jgi:hypothetical protein